MDMDKWQDCVLWVAWGGDLDGQDNGFCASAGQREQVEEGVWSKRCGSFRQRPGHGLSPLKPLNMVASWMAETSSPSKRDRVSTMNPETGSVGKFTRCYKPAANIVGWFSFFFGLALYCSLFVPMDTDTASSCDLSLWSGLRNFYKHG